MFLFKCAFVIFIRFQRTKRDAFCECVEIFIKKNQEVEFCELHAELQQKKVEKERIFFIFCDICKLYKHSHEKEEIIIITLKMVPKS